jgi:epoxyqueuosine reductase
MAYLQRNAHKRVDPQQVLPGARTIICLAASYSADNDPKSGVVARLPVPLAPQRGEGSGVRGEPNQHRTFSSCRDNEIHGDSPLTPLSGILARYARHQDYHDVLAEKLKQLSTFISEQSDSETRSLWYVDTGPLLEREFAQRAGIGFIGKHTNVISRKMGNWILLSEIITTLELEPDAPEQNHCGNCTRCITACPTQAITAPFQLDARRCISYLTIELKGSIPEEFRPAIGNRIFGCDDCLAVCPWNRFARESSLMKSHARADLERPDLIELLAIDNTEFKRRFKGTPVERSKRHGLLRNVCVALGNSADTSALPALEKAARDPEPLITEHARWAIERITRTDKTL